ncbi:hypothetical protein [Geofilum rubicundum]|nr:hypothetical protein [Geofilum rubicundum]
MEIFKKIVLVFVLSMLTVVCFGQLLETRQLLSINGGYGVLTGSENQLFFPSSVHQSGLKVEVSYEHKINPWLAGGVAMGYHHFLGPDSDHGFAEISTNGSAFLTVGPRLVLHSAYQSGGLYNRIRFGLALAPQFHFYSGERLLNIDNEIVPENREGTYRPVLEMNETSSGLGAKISPEMNYRLTQRLGLKLVYHFEFLSVYSGFEREQVAANSLMGGLIFTFGNRKSLF